MAIKGKKKSQTRGSQARRRPAAAPRPTTAGGPKKRWYQTTAGQSVAAITALVAVVIVLVLVNNARTASQEREVRQQSLENFTEQATALAQTVSEPASALAAAGQAPPADLRREAEGWRDAFTAAQTQAAQFPPAEGTTTAHQLFAQSLNLYRTAAVLFVQAAAAEGDARTEMLSTAAAQVASAESVWTAGVEVLDEARADEEMGASGVTAPSQLAAGDMPGAEATIPIEPEGESTGGGQGGGGGGGNDEDDDS